MQGYANDNSITVKNLCRRLTDGSIGKFSQLESTIKRAYVLIRLLVKLNYLLSLFLQMAHKNKIRGL